MSPFLPQSPPPASPLPSPTQRLQEPRKIARIIWGALLAGLAIFLVVAFFIRPGMGSADPGLAQILLSVLAVHSVLSVAISRLLPGRMPRRPGASPDQLALTRNIVASSVCEGAGLFAIVVFLITGPYALGILLIPLAGLLACFPSNARWEALGGGRPEPIRGSGARPR